jgi:4-diphosphocytidyl-2-C-methyl-D-erythritol kinase
MDDRTLWSLPSHDTTEKLAPAKLNLFLRVTGLRNDGYHEIVSVFVPVALYDTVWIGKQERGLEVHCEGRKVPRGRANLVHRAAACFFGNTGIEGGAEIQLTKHIPVSSGLGGGSSDAAATLLGLNQLWGKPLPDEQLQAIALSLGADVPFFLLQRPAVARGIGEILRPIEEFPPFWYVIVSPALMISTAWAYSRVRFELTKKHDLNILNYLRRRDSCIPNILSNDLESVTFGKYPFLRSIKTSLIDEGALGALMSGSGPSLFGLFDSEKKAQQAGERLVSEARGDVFVVKGLP